MTRVQIPNNATIASGTGTGAMKSFIYFPWMSERDKALFMDEQSLVVTGRGQFCSSYIDACAGHSGNGLCLFSADILPEGTQAQDFIEFPSATQTESHSGQ
jgi:hypothetical protein